MSSNLILGSSFITFNLDIQWEEENLHSAIGVAQTATRHIPLSVITSVITRLLEKNFLNSVTNVALIKLFSVKIPPKEALEINAKSATL